MSMMLRTATDETSSERLDVMTTRFGAAEMVTISASDIYVFPQGLPGLPALHRYALVVDPEYAPLGWLQAMEDPACCLTILSAALVTLPGFDAEIKRILGPDENLFPLLITRINEHEGCIVTNTLAPVILDPIHGTGQQVVIDHTRFSLCQALTWDEEAQRFTPC